MGDFFVVAFPLLSLLFLLLFCFILILYLVHYPSCCCCVCLVGWLTVIFCAFDFTITFFIFVFGALVIVVAALLFCLFG